MRRSDDCRARVRGAAALDAARPRGTVIRNSVLSRYLLESTGNADTFASLRVCESAPDKDLCLCTAGGHAAGSGPWPKIRAEASVLRSARCCRLRPPRRPTLRDQRRLAGRSIRAEAVITSDVWSVWTFALAWRCGWMGRSLGGRAHDADGVHTIRVMSRTGAPLTVIVTSTYLEEAVMPAEDVTWTPVPPRSPLRRGWRHSCTATVNSSSARQQKGRET